ncbi:MAG: hypothetical protein RLN79_01065 [Cytophagales bacterium]
MKWQETGKKTKIENLWRYIDLHKLIDFGLSRELHFLRTDKFSDPFEAITYDLLKLRYFSKVQITNPEIEEKIRNEQNEINQNNLQKFQADSLNHQKTQYINCWFESDRESLAMWNLYSNKNSVAIKVNKSVFSGLINKAKDPQYIDSDSLKYVYGPVKYLRLNPLDLFENPQLPKYSAFKKEAAYDFEKEYRLLIATPNNFILDNPEYLRLKLSEELIQNIHIICHPEMEGWKFENIENLCKSMNLNKPEKSKIEIK